MVMNPWLPFGAGTESGTVLLCLPHAGAGASVYQAWGKGLPPSVKARPVQPPGRERRRGEPALTSAEALSEELATHIAAEVRAPFAFFGHSTGALCAFETARVLRRRGGPLPVHLFVSGRRAPHLEMDVHDLAGLSIAELRDMLAGLGGTPEQVLADPDLLGMLQPLLAADFSVNERYRYYDEEALDLPVTAFAGEQDGGADPEAMAPWKEHTARRFALHTLQGGHFAVFDRAAEVHRLVGEALSAA